MIKIEKGPEPESWRRYRNTPGAQYSATGELREALLKEQGYICAYCMRRIPAKAVLSGETSHIEHLQSRHRHPDLALDYRNMVVCCPGDLDQIQHCDRSKADSDLSFDIFSDTWVHTVSYRTYDGEIHSSDPKIDKDLCLVLNLNHGRLKCNRREILAGVIEMLTKRQFKARDIRRLLDGWERKDAEGRLRPYCGIVIWYLRRKLRR